MNNLIKAINRSINAKNKVHNFVFVDSQQTYRVVKMLAKYWKTNVREAYKMYADYLFN